MTNEVLAACGGDKIIAEILYRRGFDTVEKIEAFFLHDYKPVCTSDLKDINIAVSRIIKAINSKEKICIYGDYDVDGVTSTAILTECLSQLGANCIYHVPDRFSEGYGMNAEVIKSLANKGVSLIVTCDCGIANIEEIDLANSLGMEVIVSDHHSIPEELPKALCIINPKLWEPEHLAYWVPGAVVAFYLARALLEKYGKNDLIEQFYDLTALSIVADVVPLTSENRFLLKQGLKAFTEAQRLGLKSLMEIAKANGDFDEEFIGFQIAPRLNAAGRLDSARKSVELLMARDEDAASSLAKELDSLNQARKKIESEIVEKAEQMIVSGHKDRNIFALYDDFWHHGVIGIAAGRLCEKYGKPVILMTLKEDGETTVGSARSPEGISIYEILSECSPERISFGGHDAAAGLSLKAAEVPAFIKEVERVALRYSVKGKKELDIDMELKLSQIGEDLWNSIKILAPYGQGFERPIFLSQKVKVTANLPIKNIGRRLVFKAGQAECGGVLWRQADYEEMPEECEIVYNVNQTIYKGKREIKLNILQIIENREIKEEFKPEGIRIIDLRKNPEKINDYSRLKDTIVYYEGTDKDLRQIGRNRFEIVPTNTLVMYSIPPSVEVLKSIIKRAEPQEIVFFYADEISEKEEMLRKTAGLIKFIISRKEGETSYSELTALTGLNYEIIDLMLKYFQSSGAISYEEFEDSVFIKEGMGKYSDDSERYKKAVSALNDEVLAFKRYMKNTIKPVI